MSQLTVVAPSGLAPAHDGAQDAQLVELWLSMKTSGHTRRAYAAETARFLAFVQKPLSWVTLTDLQAWAGQLEQGSLKPASQNRSVTAVKSLLSFAQETGYLPFNVGAAVKLRPNRDALAQRILEESEVAKLIEAAAEGRNRILLKLLYVSGVRVSEVCGLKWCDALARQEGGQITVFGKGGKTRTVLLKSKVWQQLLSIKGEAKAVDPIFPSRKGGGALDVSQVRRIVYAARRKAGLEQKVSPHWMRHAHASHALDRSAPIHLVQATLGHASVSTTGRYLHARPSDSSSFYLPD
jgi:integrase/recombinase XerD